MNEVKFDGEKWICPFCGGDLFTQTVVAENYVTIWTENKVLVHSDDFEGSWEVTDTGNVCCAKCGKEVYVPDHARG
jgi:hypothetical protein